jgi:ectoine hydroxylase-related dioxygenase (phytanoyl-CoA dioxygenase family)
LVKQGYTVIKSAISPEQAKAYQQKAFDWLASFNTPLDLADPSTWKAENLPVQTKLNTFESYSVVHEKFMWDLRQEDGIIEPFSRIWGTDKLVVSFDSVNITLPNRADKPARSPWPHVDQSPLRQGLHCIQGIINLSQAGPEDGSLALYPASHSLVEEYFRTQTDESSWKPEDRYYFGKDGIAWFEARGCKPIKVQADPGDLILWDSRSIHWGAEQTPKSNTIRTVVYAAYAPAALASADTLKQKKHVFEKFGATTHWPHDNMELRGLHAKLPDGQLDPKNRDRPREMPEYTDKLLRLAGVKAY